MNGKDEKLLLPPGWFATELILPSSVRRGANVRAQFSFRHNKIADDTTIYRYVLSYGPFINLTAIDLSKDTRASYSKDKNGGVLTLEFEDLEKRGFHFRQVLVFLTTNPYMPIGQQVITEQAFAKGVSVAGPAKKAKIDWTRLTYRSPTPEETKQPGTVPMGVGRVVLESKESNEKRYIIMVA